MNLEDCMTTVKPKTLPKTINPDATNQLLHQLHGHVESEHEAFQLITLMHWEYPGKPFWWLVARVLWEKERGICG